MFELSVAVIETPLPAWTVRDASVAIVLNIRLDHVVDRVGPRATRTGDRTGAAARAIGGGPATPIARVEMLGPSWR
jgi:hypothetical protein